MNTIPLDDQMAGQPDFPALITRLKLTRGLLEPAQQRVAELQGRESELKAELLALMQSSGIKTGETHGLQVRIDSTPFIQIVDEIDLVAALNEAGVYDDMLRLDVDAAKKWAAENGLACVRCHEVNHLAIVAVDTAVVS